MSPDLVGGSSLFNERTPYQYGSILLRYGRGGSKLFKKISKGIIQGKRGRGISRRSFVQQVNEKVGIE